MRTIFIPEYLAEKIEPAPNMAMISICDCDHKYMACLPRSAHLKSGWQNILRLSFDDIDAPEGNYELFHDGHAHSIITFLKAIDVKAVNTIIVHCHAGISRSAAVAKFVADFFDIEVFNHEYSLYNRHVYAVLNRAMFGSIFHLTPSK